VDLPDEEKGRVDRMLRDAAISLSLANLCYVKVWGKLLSAANSYYNEFTLAYAGVMMNVLLLAALLFAGITLSRRLRNKHLDVVSRIVFLIAVATALNGIFDLASKLSGISSLATARSRVTYFAGLGATFALIAATTWFRSKVIKFAPRVILALLPFVLVTFAQATWKLTREVGVVHAEQKPADITRVARNVPANRVVWLIFDELDEHTAFTERPANVELPELDRLRRESFYAVNAYPPAPLTYMSLPALITGKLVQKVTPVNANELMIQFAGQENAVPWSEQSNVFSEARKLGFNSGLVGWCHPYCRVIGGSLQKCDEGINTTRGDVSLQSTMFVQVEGLISTVPLVPQATIPLIQRVGPLNRIVTAGEREKYIVRYERVLQGAVKAVTDQNLDLVMVHSPVPHPPGIYDRKTKTFSRDSDTSYIDNLALVDRTVGDLRREMELDGTWNKTVVIVSADHWWRTEMWGRGPFWTREDQAVSGGRMDHRIPFMVRLPGGQNPGRYLPAFNTLLTHDLVLAILRGEVSSSETLVGWVDQHRTIADSPFNRDELLP
jgi:hypothetical protein